MATFDVSIVEFPNKSAIDQCVLAIKS